MTKPGKHQRTRDAARRANRIQLLLLILLAIGLALFFNSLKASADLLVVRFNNTDGSITSPFRLRVALTDAQRRRGLQYVKHLHADEGMLFVFPKEEQHSFWMKDTYVSLDMLFLNAQKEVVGIAADTPVLSTAPQKVERPSQYVIELAADSAKKNGITAGSVAQFETPLPRAVE